MKFFKDLKPERARIQECINKYGWTSDHNLDWFIDAVAYEPGSQPVFVEFDDGTGLLASKHPDQWRIWSDPLSPENSASVKVAQFSKSVFESGAREVWCDDVSDSILSELEKRGEFELFNYYSLSWPVMDMEKYDPELPGGHFKELRNARNKFYREHKIEVKATGDVSRGELIKIIDDWKNEFLRKNKEDIFDSKYRAAVENDFRGFKTARVMIVDGRPAGMNAGYEVPNHPGRFAGIIGLHDYSVHDLGDMLWLEDLEWVKNAGYKEFDLQGVEYDWELKTKLKFGARIERKTNTFSIKKK